MMREKMLNQLVDHLMSIPDRSEHMTDHPDMMGNSDDVLDDGVVGDDMNKMSHESMTPEGTPKGAEITAIKIEKKPHSMHGAFPMQKNHFGMKK